jgi:hyperosmotically inducible periplasmic protein
MESVMPSSRTLAATLLASGCLTLAVATTPTRADHSLSDERISARIKLALVGSPVTKATQIEVVTRDGAVNLNGFVDGEASRAEAVRVAGQVAGVVSVHSDLLLRDGPETLGNAVDDSAITVRIKSALFAQSTVPAHAVHVSTSHGVVELTGLVESPAARDQASALARNVTGVRQVINRLQVL